MSYDIKIQRKCDNRIFDERQITESDGITVKTNHLIANDNVTVKVNGYELERNYKSELAVTENVTNQFDGTKNSFVVANSPIYDGLNLRRYATSTSQVLVQIQVIDEDNSSQITGIEKTFICQHIPLLTEFNWSTTLNDSDVIVKINGDIVEIDDADALTGRITLKERPLATDIVTVSYFFKAKVSAMNPLSGLVTIEEFPKLGQQVNVKYVGLVKDGWNLVRDENNPSIKNIEFDRIKKTNRHYVEQEDVTTQFTGTEKTFQTEFYPLMPFKADLRTTYEKTLPSSVIVTINGERVLPVSINAENGTVTFLQAPNATDIVLVSYWYQSDIIPDVISVDYQVDERRCPKCNRIGLVDDFEFDVTGSLLIVRNEEKLIQDFRKIVITIKGSNAEHLWYGTNLDSLIGSAYLPEFIETQLSTEIQTAFRDLKSLQVKQESYQTVTDQEFLDFINYLQIVQNTTDPTIWAISVDIVSQASTIAQLNEEIKFDSPFFLQDNSFLVTTNYR